MPAVKMTRSSKPRVSVVAGRMTSRYLHLDYVDSRSGGRSGEGHGNADARTVRTFREGTHGDLVGGGQ